VVAAALLLATVACGGAAAAGSAGPESGAAPNVPPGAPNAISSRGGVSYGIDLNYNDRNIGLARVPTALAAIRAAGATIVRTGVSWSALEPASGVYRWGLLDRGLALIRRDGLRVLWELGHTPAWDLPSGVKPGSGRVNYPPRDCEGGGSCGSAATFVQALLEHAVVTSRCLPA
jgi:hypothetical protein